MKDSIFKVNFIWYYKFYDGSLKIQLLYWLYIRAECWYLIWVWRVFATALSQGKWSHGREGSHNKVDNTFLIWNSIVCDCLELG